ncbi:MAG: hypothetical protein GYA58_00855 [Anaerolineaceae bacterium]|nr:hypothetical protein [Anaerolineaceae bacterium]
MRGISSFPISQDLLQELRQLSTALPEVSQRLEGNEVRDRLKRISPNGRFLLLSDEEGELVSRYGAQVFREQGIDAQAACIAEVMNWPAVLRSRYDQVLYLGSGSSAELHTDFVDRLFWLGGAVPEEKTQTAPLIPFEPWWQGSLPFVSLGLFLWGLAHQWTRNGQTDWADSFKKFRQRVMLQVDGLEYLTGEWEKLLSGCTHLQLIGVGLNQIAAQFTVQKLQSWLGANVGWYPVEDIPLIPASACIIMGELPGQWVASLQAEKRTCIFVPEGFPERRISENLPGSDFPASLTALLNVVCGEIIALSLSNRNSSF